MITNNNLYKYINFPYFFLLYKPNYFTNYNFLNNNYIFESKLTIEITFKNEIIINKIKYPSILKENKILKYNVINKIIISQINSYFTNRKSFTSLSTNKAHVNIKTKKNIKKKNNIFLKATEIKWIYSNIDYIYINDDIISLSYYNELTKKIRLKNKIDFGWFLTINYDYSKLIIKNNENFYSKCLENIFYFIIHNSNKNAMYILQIDHNWKFLNKMIHKKFSKYFLHIELLYPYYIILKSFGFKNKVINGNNLIELFRLEKYLTVEYFSNVIISQFINFYKNTQLELNPFYSINLKNSIFDQSDLYLLFNNKYINNERYKEICIINLIQNNNEIKNFISIVEKNVNYLTNGRKSFLMTKNTKRKRNTNCLYYIFVDISSYDYISNDNNIIGITLRNSNIIDYDEFVYQNNHVFEEFLYSYKFCLFKKLST